MVCVLAQQMHYPMRLWPMHEAPGYHELSPLQAVTMSTPAIITLFSLETPDIAEDVLKINKKRNELRWVISCTELTTRVNEWHPRNFKGQGRQRKRWCLLVQNFVP